MKCPKCKNDLNWLKNYSRADKIYCFEAGEVGFNYAELDEISLENTDEFFCPECDELLTKSEKEAMRFLK